MKPVSLLFRNGYDIRARYISRQDYTIFRWKLDCNISHWILGYSVFVETLYPRQPINFLRNATLPIAIPSLLLVQIFSPILWSRSIREILYEFILAPFRITGRVVSKEGMENSRIFLSNFVYAIINNIFVKIIRYLILEFQYLIYRNSIRAYSPTTETFENCSKFWKKKFVTIILEREMIEIIRSRSFYSNMSLSETTLCSVFQGYKSLYTRLRDRESSAREADTTCWRKESSWFHEALKDEPSSIRSSLTRSKKTVDGCGRCRLSDAR